MTEHVPVKIDGPDGLVHLCRSPDTVTMCRIGYQHVPTDAPVSCDVCRTEGIARAQALFDALDYPYPHLWRFTPDGAPAEQRVWICWAPNSGEARSGRQIEQLLVKTIARYWHTVIADGKGIVAWAPILDAPRPGPPTGMEPIP